MNMTTTKITRKHRLLFICLGNICRSPAAEGVMKAKVHAAILDEQFFIDSAGIGNWHAGQLPDSRMRERGARRGYRLDSRARQIRLRLAARDGSRELSHRNVEGSRRGGA